MLERNNTLLLSVYKFSEYLFPKGLLIYQKKTTPRSIYFLGNYDWSVGFSLEINTGGSFSKVVYIYSHIGNEKNLPK